MWGTGLPANQYTHRLGTRSTNPTSHNPRTRKQPCTLPSPYHHHPSQPRRIMQLNFRPQPSTVTSQRHARRNTGTWRVGAVTRLLHKSESRKQSLGVNNVRSTTGSRGRTAQTYCQTYCQTHRQELSSGAHANQDSSRQGRCRLFFGYPHAHAMRLRALSAVGAHAAILLFPTTSTDQTTNTGEGASSEVQAPRTVATTQHMHSHEHLRTAAVHAHRAAQHTDCSSYYKDNTK
jgi:hypothetical protein